MKLSTRTRYDAYDETASPVSRKILPPLLHATSHPCLTGPSSLLQGILIVTLHCAYPTITCTAQILRPPNLMSPTHNTWIAEHFGAALGISVHSTCRLLLGMKLSVFAPFGPSSPSVWPWSAPWSELDPRALSSQVPFSMRSMYCQISHWNLLSALGTIIQSPQLSLPKADSGWLLRKKK